MLKDQRCLFREGDYSDEEEAIIKTDPFDIRLNKKEHIYIGTCEELNSREVALLLDLLDCILPGVTVTVAGASYSRLSRDTWVCTIGLMDNIIDSLSDSIHEQRKNYLDQLNKLRV